VRRGNPLKGGRTLGAEVLSLAGLVLGKSVRRFFLVSMCLVDGLVPFSDGVCAF